MRQIIADAFQFIDIGIGIHRQNTINRHGPHIQLINLLVVDDRQVSGVVNPFLEIPDIFIGLCHIIGDVRIRTSRIGNCPKQIRQIIGTIAAAVIIIILRFRESFLYLNILYPFLAALYSFGVQPWVFLKI